MTPKKFLDEASAMKGLDHPNIVKLLAIVSEREPYMIITEFVEKGDLRNHLVNDDDDIIGETELYNFSYQAGISARVVLDRNVIQ